MSNRVFKKVFGGDDLKQVSPESDDEHPFTAKSSRPLNPYALLNELSESEAKEDDGLQGGGQSSADSTQKTEPSTSTKKKRRKKRPAKNKKQTQEASGSDKAFDTEMEEDAAIRQRQKANRPGARKHVEEAQQPIKANAAFEELFKIDTKFINSEFELKRIFGAKIINYERNKQGQRRIYRQSKLVMPKEQWPSVAGSGIAMSYLNTLDGFLYFKIEHNSHYQDVQKQFIKAVDTLNPDNIVSILRLHPYHIDSHIQLSDMAKAAEDMSVAADLVEGAIHCLENAFHVRFNLMNPLCRLEYKFQENRAFFILLFKHLVLVGQRACHRTAMELCKILLFLDPVNDPLCVTLMIDFYALKAAEYEWLIKLFNFWEKSRNLDQLPNFSYSIPLAYHLLSLKNSGGQSEEFASKADNLIQYAMIMFPSILLPLLDKVGVQIDSRVKHHNYFNAFAQSSQSRSLRLLCDLYVWRTYHVWREPSVLVWLERNVGVVLDKVDAQDALVRDYEGKRQRRYKATTPRSILRHILLTDNKDLTFNFPPELSKEPIMSTDPLPPTDAIDIYKFQQIRNTNPNRRAGILNMLIDSLWNDLNAQQQPPRDQPVEQQPLRVEEAEPVGGAEGEAPIALGAGLQQSVTALLDAMRDLLSNANGRPEGEAADGEESATDVD